MSDDWRGDLQALGEAHWVINKDGYTYPANQVPAPGQVEQAARVQVRADYSAALFATGGDGVSRLDMLGWPVEWVRATTTASYYKNAPNTSAVWNGAVDLPYPVPDTPFYSLTSNDYSTLVDHYLSPIPYGVTYGFPDAVTASSSAFALRFRLAEMVAQAKAAAGPQAGRALPYVPPGATLEWEYPDPEVVRIEAAAVTKDGVDANGLITWYRRTSIMDFGPLGPGDPLPGLGGGSGGFVPTDAPWGRWWQFGGTAGGSEIVNSERDSNLFRILPGQVGDLDVPELYEVVAAGRLIQGPVKDEIPMAESRPDQWLAFQVIMRARRYRLVGNEAVRKYPRNTGGFSTSASQYPAAKASRLVGGYP